MFNRAALFGLVTVVAVATIASAQDGWRRLGRQEPSDVKLTITTAKSRWYLGEPIPLRLSFTASKPNAYSADTNANDRHRQPYSLEEFVVDPAAATEDPIQGRSASSPGMGGNFSGPIILSEKPFSIETILNRWIRFRKPGSYRLYVVSRRVRPATQAARAPFELVSNVITLHVESAPAAWVKQPIALAVKILDVPEAPFDQAAQQERKRAATILRCLTSPDAARELVTRLTGMTKPPVRSIKVCSSRLIARSCCPSWSNA